MRVIRRDYDQGVVQLVPGNDENNLKTKIRNAQKQMLCMTMSHFSVSIATLTASSMPIVSDSARFAQPR